MSFDTFIITQRHNTIRTLSSITQGLPDLKGTETIAGIPCQAGVINAISAARPLYPSTILHAQRQEESTIKKKSVCAGYAQSCCASKQLP
jgi:hypothetical protein